MKSQAHKGFTIIELMVTIAIVGMLAGIAVPAYTSYTDKALLLEAVGVASSLKAEVEEEFTMTGGFPHGPGVRFPLDSDVLSSYEYWSPAGWQNASRRVIWVHVYLESGIYPGASIQKALILEGRAVGGGLQWKCGTHPGFRIIPAEYLPSGCDEVIGYP